jgi:hypothetical protein
MNYNCTYKQRTSCLSSSLKASWYNLRYWRGRISIIYDSDGEESGSYIRQWQGRIRIIDIVSTIVIHSMYNWVLYIWSGTAIQHIYQQSRLPGMDWTLLDTMLQKLGMSCQTTSGKKHLSINLRVWWTLGMAAHATAASVCDFKLFSYFFALFICLFFF